MTERLLQDEMEGYECQRLSRWFASRLDCREVVRRTYTNKLTGVNTYDKVGKTGAHRVPCGADGGNP